MKFGDHLSSKIYEPWRSNYLEYNKIKLEMKQRQLKSGWNKQDEVEFCKKLESELAKVYAFVDQGLKSLNKRIEEQQAVLDQLMSTPKPSKKKFDAIADQLTEVLFDTNDLAKFQQLNMTGFEKLLKKHDRYTKMDLTTKFRHQLSSTWPLDKLSLSFDVLIVKISDLHDICHLHGHPRQQHLNNDQTNFERATAKYWIHPDNITEVKSIILFHLPVHVFNKDKQYEESDMAVSSVYYDNDQFDLFKERLSRDEGAEAIRLRWYGPLKNENDDIYIERKTHRATWLNGKSVKDRFRISESQVNSFISGKYTPDQIGQELREKYQHKKDVDILVKDTQFIAGGIQKSVRKRQLHPKCRVFYNRTAFQLPGDQKLRISLDCNLTFIREDEGREKINSKQYNWRRKDIGINYPFRSIPEKDISRFPYAILETKLQTHLGQEPPIWLTKLIDSHLVHEVPRFSKYLHGAAMLFNKDVPYIPYWFPKFDQDIRRPPVKDVGLSRSMSFKPLVNGHHRQSLLMNYEQEQKQPVFNKSKSLGDFFNTNTNSKLTKHKDDGSGNKPHLSINFLDSSNEGHPKEEKGSKDLIQRIWNYGPHSLNSSLTLQKKPQEDIGSPILLSKDDKKKLKKIEPKTFFANERTFISWLQFCALLLTVALNLLNNGDQISRIIGAVFLIISSLISFYALGRYQIRARHLRNNDANVRYDDIWGPTVLCVVLVVALIVNFYLRIDTINGSYYQVQHIDSSK